MSFLGVDQIKNLLQAGAREDAALSEAFDAAIHTKAGLLVMNALLQVVPALL